MSCAVALNAAGRLEGAIFAGVRVREREGACAKNGCRGDVVGQCSKLDVSAVRVEFRKRRRELLETPTAGVRPRLGTELQMHVRRRRVDEDQLQLRVESSSVQKHPSCRREYPSSSV